jgi:hypothetical protein
MSKTYTITLTDAEDKALAFVAASQEEWITNVVKERCRIAIDEIVNAEVQRKFAAGEPISGTKEDVVLDADIETVAERNTRVEAEEAAKLAE